ncbi:MAG: hypothetical protein PHE68_03305 [Candidatus Peribacteraceae bacterium]|nr:hypothetical protein [Candidatus Peribacteraceae bacterium]
MPAHPSIRHRHFVALPVFGGVLALFLLIGSGVHSSVKASLTGTSDTHGGVMTLSQGMQVIRGDEGQVEAGDPPVLVRGAALFAHPGIFEVKAGSFLLSGLAGAFHVVMNGDSVTVSAITTPVLIEQNGLKVMVPVGYQWRGAGDLPELQSGIYVWATARAIDPLPQHFLREQLLALNGLQESDTDLPPVVQDAAAEEESFGLLLPKARTREHALLRDRVLGVLRYRLEKEDRTGAQVLLKDRRFIRFFDEADSIPALAVLATRHCGEAPDVCADLLSRLSVRTDLWLLSAYHPGLRSAVWAQDVPALSQEERLLLAFTLPSSDSLAASLSPVVLTWWAAQASSLVSGSDARTDLVTELLLTHFPVVKRFAEGGYPERAAEIVQGLGAIAEPMKSVLSADLLKGLTEAEAQVEHSVELSALDEVSSVSSAAAKSTSSSALQEKTKGVDHVDRVATSMLEGAGALFTTQTRIEPTDDRHARVDGILFGAADGDHTYTFDFNVVEEEISGIVRDGKEMPYALTYRKFLEWVRK